MELRGLTRRQLLEALLAAPVALAACKRSAPPPIEGALYGQSMDVGHLLREASRTEPPSERRHVNVAIVGGGPSGLSAAWRLERLGVSDFLVFDLEERAGGTSRYGDDGVVPYPWGAHYVPLPSADNRALVTLLREMGALADSRGIEGAEEQLVRAPEERLFHMGRWAEGLYPRAGASSADLEELGRFRHEIDRWVAFRDARGRRAFTIPIAHASDDPEVTALDAISMATWLERGGFTSARLRWLVDYACRDDYGLLAKDTSAWAGVFYFASRVAAPGEEAAPLLSWPEGNGRLVRHLASVARQDRVRTGSLVTDVVLRDDGVDFTVLDTKSRTLASWSCDHLVYAAPKFTAKHVLRPYREAPPPHLASLDYGAWMVANLHLASRPASRGFPLAWDNVLFDSPSLGYVVATHQALRDHGPTIWTYYYPMTDEAAHEGRARLLATDHASWCDAIVSDLARAHTGLRDAISRIDVFRWGHAMARPKVSSMFGGALQKAREPLGRVYFAHSDLSGMGLFEEAQHWGIRAAEEIARRTGRDVQSLLTT